MALVGHCTWPQLQHVLQRGCTWSDPRRSHRCDQRSLAWRQRSRDAGPQFCSRAQWVRPPPWLLNKQVHTLSCFFSSARAFARARSCAEARAPRATSRAGAPSARQRGKALFVMSTPEPHVDLGLSDCGAIQGLTHPNRWLVAANHLWKRRGALTANFKTNWVERLVVLTDTALFWFETGAIASSTQQGRIELRHVRSIKLQQAGGGTSVTIDELERFGPKHQVEITHCMSDHSCVLGGTDASLVQIWHEAITNAVNAAQSQTSGASAVAPPGASPGVSPGASPAAAAVAAGTPPSPIPVTPQPLCGPRVSPTSASLLRHELTGIVAMGILGKARQATTGHMKTALEQVGVLTHRDGRPRDGWSTRVVVLTDSALHFYKPASSSKKHEVRTATAAVHPGCQARCLPHATCRNSPTRSSPRATGGRGADI